VDVVAVLNDTTGTLLAGSYLDKHCGIGLIMGIKLPCLWRLQLTGLVVGKTRQYHLLKTEQLDC